MNLTEHSIALISVIVGMGLSQLLSDFNGLIHARSNVRWHPLPLVWGVLTLTMITNYWWILYKGVTAAVASANAAEFSLHMVLPILLYLICAAALPTINSDQKVDLLDDYMQTARYYFSLIFIYLIVATTEVIYKAGGEFTLDKANIARTVLFILVAPLIYTRSLRYHWVVTGFIVINVIWRLSTQLIR